MMGHKGYLEEKRGKIAAEGILSSKMIDFYILLFDFHSTYCGLYIDRVSDLPVLDHKKMPAFDHEKIILTEGVKSIMLDSLPPLLLVIKKFFDGANYDTLKDSIESDVSSIEYYMSSLLKCDYNELLKMGKLNRMNIQEFIFIMVNWLKPFFISLLEINKEKMFFDDWQLSSCPFCGYFPDMIKIVESFEGKRFLHCALCENEWPYKRISCTVCQNEDINTLGYFLTESKTPYRIDYCDKCKEWYSWPSECSCNNEDAAFEDDE